jgi:tetratricopeptide (TPR) repeat protein
VQGCLRQESGKHRRSQGHARGLPHPRRFCFAWLLLIRLTGVLPFRLVLLDLERSLKIEQSKVQRLVSQLLVALALVVGCNARASGGEEWYVVLSAGQSPARYIFLADMGSLKSKSPGLQSVAIAYIAEAAGNPRYTKTTLEYDCGSGNVVERGSKSITYESTELGLPDKASTASSNPLFERIRKLACNGPAFMAAREAARENGGDINSGLLSAQLAKSGLGSEPLLLLTRKAIPDFEAVLNIVWTVFWKARPPEVKAANQALAANEQRPEMVKESPQALVDLGLSQKKIGNLDGAIASFKRAISVDGLYAPAYSALGATYLELGDFDVALAGYNRAIDINPRDASSLFNRAVIYFEQKQNFAKAEADFTQAIQLDPQDAKSYFRRADLYESWGKSSQADADRKRFESLGGNALPGFENVRRALFPATEFDAKTAAEAIKEGSSTLTGRACAYVRNGLWGLGGTERFDAAKVRVALFPWSPYLQQWYELRERKEDKDTGVFIGQEAQQQALQTKTNQKGEFVFSRLKPGKYFLQIVFNFTQVKTKRVNMGSDVSQVGNVVITQNYYQDRDFFIDRNSRLESFVDIAKDGEVKKITVMNAKFGLQGCRD